MKKKIDIKFGISCYAPACRRHVLRYSARVSKKQTYAAPLFITLSDHMSYGVRRSVRAKKQIVESNSMNASYTTILMFMIKGITCGDVISIDLC